jgi:hypothetical protein
VLATTPPLATVVVSAARDVDVVPLHCCAQHNSRARYAKVGETARGPAKTAYLEQEAAPAREASAVHRRRLARTQDATDVVPRTFDDDA